jgi:hypothetical protein
MLAALVLDALGDPERTVHLYDTFAGMTEPDERDRSNHRESAALTWERSQAGDINEWCYSPLEEVRSNMLSTGFPAERLRFVQGQGGGHRPRLGARADLATASRHRLSTPPPTTSSSTCSRCSRPAAC